MDEHRDYKYGDRFEITRNVRQLVGQRGTVIPNEHAPLNGICGRLDSGRHCYLSYDSIKPIAK